ncbi:MAG: hypothetical protein ACOZQL_24025 [Myxococcota bacterium]
MARRTPSLRALLRRPLGEVIAGLSPAALAAAGLARCAGCAMAPFETVGEAARIFHLDPQRVARALAAARKQEDAP